MLLDDAHRTKLQLLIEELSEDESDQLVRAMKNAETSMLTSLVSTIAVSALMQGNQPALDALNAFFQSATKSIRACEEEAIESKDRRDAERNLSQSA